jgi:RHS repeat-associated protein
MDANQNIVARYLYDPFGRLLAQRGTLGPANRMQFSSMPHHAPSGLSLYTFRAYDPTLQRWLSHDPIGERGGINLYDFVRNNSLSAADPLGLDVISVDDSVNWVMTIVDIVFDALDIAESPTDLQPQSGQVYVPNEPPTWAIMVLGFSMMAPNLSPSTSATAQVATPPAAVPQMSFATRVSRFCYDDRPFRTISREYWEANGPAEGSSLHHWLFPQSATWVPQGIRNAGFNLMELPPIIDTPFGGLNQWMGMSGSPWAPTADWVIRLAVPGSLAGAAYGGGRIGQSIFDPVVVGQ